MIIFLLGLNQSELEFLEKNLKEDDHDVRVFRKFADMMDGCQKHFPVDLIIMDYKILGSPPFTPFEFNPFNYLIRSGFYIPLIFYNDPFPECGKRALYWKIQNLHFYYGYISSEKMNGLIPFLHSFSDFIERNGSFEILPSLGKNSDDGKNEALESNALKNGNEFDPIEFKTRHKIISSRFSLFMVLWKHREQGISIREICRELWGRCEDRDRQNLRTYIYYLRKIFKKEKNHFLEIVRIQKEKYLLHIKEKGPAHL